MRVLQPLAAASMVGLGLWALPTSAVAMPFATIASSLETAPLVQKTSGYDGYSFGIEGHGCGFGHGGGTGYKGCFIYDKNFRYQYGYAPYRYGKKPYGKRDNYRYDNKYKNRKGYYR